MAPAIIKATIFPEVCSPETTSHETICELKLETFEDSRGHRDNSSIEVIAIAAVCAITVLLTAVTVIRKVAFCMRHREDLWVMHGEELRIIRQQPFPVPHLFYFQFPSWVDWIGDRATFNIPGSHPSVHISNFFTASRLVEQRVQSLSRMSPQEAYNSESSMGGGSTNSISGGGERVRMT